MSSRNKRPGHRLLTAFALAAVMATTGAAPGADQSVNTANADEWTAWDQECRSAPLTPIVKISRDNIPKDGLYTDADPKRGLGWRAYLKANQLHRDNAAAMITCDLDYNVAKGGEYWQHGEKHREGRPAWLERDPATGTIVWELYWDHGKQHRLDGPALTQRDADTGRPVWQEYWVNDQIHRGGGQPAVIAHDPATGTQILREFWNDGRLDKKDGPAIEQFDAKGRAVHVEFWEDGHRLRTVDYDPETGAVTKERSWPADAPAEGPETLPSYVTPLPS